MRATIVFVAWFCSVAILAGLDSTQAIARAGNLPLTPCVAIHSAMEETKDLALQEAKLVERWDATGKAAADHGKRCFIDLNSLKFITEPNGQQVADVWIKCEVDDAARARMIDARYGEQESVEGFERLVYVKQHVWFNLADPAYRNPSSLPLRMIAQEVYYDTYGEVIHSTVPLTTWRGGKWFTLPGFEEIVQKIMAARGHK